MTRNDYLKLSDEELIKHCTIDFFKATGPGGQKKNKTESAVRLTLKEDSITASASEERQQSVNRIRALKRLKLQIALEMREPAEKWTGQLNMNPKNSDYPLFVGCLIDNLVDQSWQISSAAANLGLSTGQLIKILGKSDTLWQFINREKQKAGHKVLKK